MSCKIDFINDWELRHQGAESRLYFGLHSNNRCVIKHRFSKNYRHQLLDKKLTKERTKRERKMIERVHSKSQELGPYMPKVVWSNEDTIIMTEISPCETLYDYIDRESPTCR
jgi:tRNA A-37 threonylcarbamoyl transferase component Bud32